MLSTESHFQYGFEAAECGGVAVLGDRIGLIEAQDVVRVASQSREDAGVFPNARRVLAQRDVASVVELVLYTPMLADGARGMFRVDWAIGQIERGFG